MSFTDNPIMDFERYDAEQEERIKHLPVCCCCRERIQQEDAVRIENDWYCDRCLDEMREETLKDA